MYYQRYNHFQPAYQRRGDGVQVAIIGRQDSTKTLSNGYFSFTNIPPGSYILSFIHPAFRSANANVSVQCGQDTPIGNVILQERTGMITGKVLDIDTGEPIANASLRTLESGVNCATNSEGYFTFNNIRVGVYTLEASANSYSKVKLTGVEVKENLITNLPDIKLLKNPSGLMACVRDSITDAVLQGVNVTVIEVNLSQVTDSVGLVSFTALRPGVYSVKFELLNYNSTVKTNVCCSANQVLNLGNIALIPKNGTINGTTTSGAKVELRGTSLTATATGTGAFTLTNVVPGSYNLDISLTNYESKTVPVSVSPNQTVNIGDQTLTGLPGSIAGMTMATSVLIVELNQTVTPTDSSFRFTNVPNGKYTVRFAATNFYSQDVSVTVGPNQTKDLGTVNLSPMPGKIIGYASPGCTGILIELQSAQNGALSYQNLLPGAYTLKIEQAKHRFRLININLGPNETYDVGMVTSGDLYPNINDTTETTTVTCHAVGSNESKSIYCAYNQTVNYSWSIHWTMFCNAWVKIDGERYGYAVQGAPDDGSGSLSWGKGNHSLISAAETDSFGAQSESTVRITYQRDISIPQIAFSKTYGYNAHSYTLTASATDLYNTVTKMEYALTKTLGAPGVYTEISNGSVIGISGAGVWYLYVRATDYEGNVGEQWEGPFVIN
ncbi:MAG TPA: carboxypeptidase regulatory-like domain-containing protein [Bacillota bacterium]|nr:carboxypeptidase regulatory-like domain-containing protein [Bacillota bacterium]